MRITKKRIDALENCVIILGRIYSGWKTSLYLVKKLHEVTERICKEKIKSIVSDA